MKNLIFFLLAVTVLFFASCTKEAITEPIVGTELSIEQRSQTIQIQVSRVTHSVVSGELLIDFEAPFDFTSAVLESTQYFTFEDASGNQLTLTFQTNTFSGSNELLQSAFAVGTNNLTGLTLLEAQDVIIEDEIFE